MRGRVVESLHRLHAKYPRPTNLILGIAYPLHPSRIGDLIHLWGVVLRHYAAPLRASEQFPDPAVAAARRPDGLLAVGGPLTTQRLISAYRSGIYPWCHVGPMKWWAPSERMVLFLEESHISKTLRRTLRLGTYRVTFDNAFEAVVRACAEPRPGKLPLTWISPGIARAYVRLHSEGYAHSAEVWAREGGLVGGLYGVAIGGAFFTESLFAKRLDASKVAFVTINRHLQHWGFRLNDCKAYSEHHASQGARLIGREEFMRHLRAIRDLPGPPAPWSVDESLDVAAWSPSRDVF